MATTIGDFEVEEVIETIHRPRHSSLIPDFSEEALERHRSWLVPDYVDDSGRLLLPIRTYVLRTPRSTILVDTCFGNDKERAMRDGNMRSGPFMDDLRKAGVSPDRVDFVLCTHLHLDHVGWNTRLDGGQWVPTFPNARYLFSTAEWERWKDEEDPNWVEIMGDSVHPVVNAGLVDLVEGGHTIEDGIRITPLPGHTPGHVGVEIESGGRTAVMTGDMMHHPVQVAEPGWNSRACTDPEQSKATRQSFVDRYAGSKVLLLAAHFNVPEGGYIVEKNGARRLELA